MQDLVDRCLSANPAMRPSLSAISDALLAIRDSIIHNSPPPLACQSPPQQTSPQQASPFAQPPLAPEPGTAAGADVRQAMTRERINATQWQVPGRRRWVGAAMQQTVSRNGLIRQGSTPQRSSSQADRIPAEWGRIAKLESKRSAPVRGEVVHTAADEAAVIPAVLPDNAPKTCVDGSSQTDPPENIRTPCLQQVWRTMGFCYAAKHTKSFREDSTGVNSQPPQAESLADSSTAVSSDATAVDGINAGSKQGSPKMSLRVKKMFADQSKQIRQCLVTACK